MRLHFFKRDGSVEYTFRVIGSGSQLVEATHIVSCTSTTKYDVGTKHEFWVDGFYRTYEVVDVDDTMAILQEV